MRRTSRPLVPLLVASLAVPAATGVLAAPVSARTPEPPDACKQPLDQRERETYRFMDGRRTWSPGRVVVTPSRADENRYCVEVRFGGRSVFHQSSTKGWARQNGRWVVIGGDGGGGDLARSYTRSIQIRARRRVEFRYDVQIQGRWYRASFRVQNL